MICTYHNPVEKKTNFRKEDSMKELKIDREFQALIPPLSDEEFRQLETNVLKDGCRDALVTWKGTLVDGHNRYEICSKHDIPFQTVERDFSDRQSAIEWIILNQFGRRNLTAFQRSELALKLKPVIQEKARENIKTSGEYFGKGSQKSDEPISKIRTDEELAKTAGVSRDTIRKVETIKKEGTPEQIERARKGGKGNTVNAIVNEIQSAKNETKVCAKCGQTKPLSDFYVGKNSCKDCVNSSKKIRDFKGNVIKSNPETDELFKEYGAKAISDLYDESNAAEYTTDDMVEEIQSLIDHCVRNTKSCLKDHSTLLSDQKNKQKIIAVLSEAETAIKKIKELFI